MIAKPSMYKCPQEDIYDFDFMFGNEEAAKQRQYTNEAVLTSIAYAPMVKYCGRYIIEKLLRGIPLHRCSGTSAK